MSKRQLVDGLKGVGLQLVKKQNLWPVLWEYLGSAEAIAQHIGCDVKDVPIPPTVKPVQQLKEVEARHKPAKVVSSNGAPQLAAELLRAASGIQEAYQHMDTECNFAEVYVDEKLPFGICFAGDLHIGSMGTDHEGVLRVLDFIHKTPGLYLMLNGDTINNYIAASYDEERHKQPLAPSLQKEAAQLLLRWLKGKCLALTSGQHEDWSIKQDDFDPGAFLANAADSVYLGRGGELLVHCKNWYFEMGLWHAYRGSSMYDQLAAAKRCYREHGAGRWRITAVADKHSAAICKEYLHGMERVFVRCGTAKLYDPYAKRLGYTQTQFLVPVAIIDPATGEIEVFLKLSAAAGYLAHLRRKR